MLIKLSKATRFFHKVPPTANICLTPSFLSPHGLSSRARGPAQRDVGVTSLRKSSRADFASCTSSTRQLIGRARQREAARTEAEASTAPRPPRTPRPRGTTPTARRPDAGDPSSGARRGSCPPPWRAADGPRPDRASGGTTTGAARSPSPSQRWATSASTSCARSSTGWSRPPSRSLAMTLSKLSL